MEEMEVPTEHLNEEINENAEARKNKKKWSLYVAISTALMAVLAAIASLMAGQHSNDSLFEQIKATDLWNQYQAKSIKAVIVSRVNPAVTDSSKMKQYVNDEQEIMNKAKEHEKDSAIHLHKHEILARAVTLIQIAIAISAISILTERKPLWYLSIVLALIGVVFFISEFL